MIGQQSHESQEKSSGLDRWSECELREDAGSAMVYVTAGTIGEAADCSDTCRQSII